MVERHDDGRLDIIARGETPFRVLDRFEADEWPAAVVEMIDVDDSTARMPAELKEAQEAFAKLLEAVGADPARAEASDSAYPIAAQVEMPPVDKQLLLEEADERERLQALAGSLRRLHSGLLRARRDANHARSNGHKPGTIPKSTPDGPGGAGLVVIGRLTARGRSAGLFLDPTPPDLVRPKLTAPPRRGSPPPRGGRGRRRPPGRRRRRG